MKKILFFAAAAFISFSSCLISCGEKSNMDKIHEAQELFKESVRAAQKGEFDKATELQLKSNSIMQEIDYNSLTDEEKIEFGRITSKEFMNEATSGN